MHIPFLNKLRTEAAVGVDVGTASIKAVELIKESGRFKLLNYGIFELESQMRSAPPSQKTANLPDHDVVFGLKEIFRQAHIRGRKVVASIPSFSTFSTVIPLPYLSEKDLAKTIPFEAKKYVPTPLKEVILDWSIISIEAPNGAKVGSGPPNVEIFLAAVPKGEVERYQKIMAGAGLQLVALELENIALIRSLVGNDLSPVAIVNIGGRSTSILVADKGYERMSHNYEIGGFEITKSIARSMDISFSRAEELKKTIGLKSDNAHIISEAMVSLIDMMVFEAKKTINNYENSANVKVHKVILVGGLAGMPNFLPYFKGKIGLDVNIGNPFARVAYPRELSGLVSELAPALPIAIGLAMRGV